MHRTTGRIHDNTGRRFWFFIEICIAHREDGLDLAGAQDLLSWMLTRSNWIRAIPSATGNGMDFSAAMMGLLIERVYDTSGSMVFRSLRALPWLLVLAKDGLSKAYDTTTTAARRM